MKAKKPRIREGRQQAGKVLHILRCFQQPGLARRVTAMPADSLEQFLELAIDRHRVRTLPPAREPRDVPLCLILRAAHRKRVQSELLFGLRRRGRMDRCERRIAAPEEGKASPGRAKARVPPPALAGEGYRDHRLECADVGELGIAGEKAVQPRCPRTHVADDDYRRPDRSMEDLGLVTPQLVRPDSTTQQAHQLAVGDGPPKRVQFRRLLDIREQQLERRAPMSGWHLRQGSLGAKGFGDQSFGVERGFGQQLCAPQALESPIDRRDQRQIIGRRRISHRRPLP